MKSATCRQECIHSSKRRKWIEAGLTAFVRVGMWWRFPAMIDHYPWAQMEKHSELAFLVVFAVHGLRCTPTLWEISGLNILLNCHGRNTGVLSGFSSSIRINIVSIMQSGLFLKGNYFAIKALIQLEDEKNDRKQSCTQFPFSVV